MSKRIVRVAICLFASLFANSAAAFVVNGEFRMNGDSIPPGPTGDQVSPSVTYNQNNDSYFVVWEAPDASGRPRILGAHLREDGERLWTAPQVICSYPKACQLPKVAYQAGYYLVIWSDLQNGAIFGQRVDSSGFPTGGVITIANSNDRDHQPSVAAGANKFVVVYTKNYVTPPYPNGTSALFVVDISPSTGTVLQHFRLDIMPGFEAAYSEPAVIARVDSAGVHFDVVFRSESDGYASILMMYSHNDNLAMGGWFDSAQLDWDAAGCSQPHDPTQAVAGTGLTWVVFTMLCPDYAGGLQEELFVASPGNYWARRLATWYQYLETRPSLVASPWDGSLWLTFHQSDRAGTWSRPLVWKLDSDAQLRGGIDPQEIPAPSIAPAIAANGRAVLAVWGDTRNGGYGVDLFASRISSEIVDLDPIDLRVARDWPVDITQEEPAAASAKDGNINLLVWTERTRDVNGDIHGLLVDREGNPLTNIVISALDYPEGSPAVASDGENFFVVWDVEKLGDDYSRIQGAVVLADGTVGPAVDLSYTGPSAWSEDPAVTYVRGEHRYVVAWQAEHGNGLDIHGNVVKTDWDQAFPALDYKISTARVEQRRVAISATYDSALVVWEEGGRGHPSVNVYGTRLRGWDSFTPGPEVQITEVLDGDVNGDQFWPAVACEPDGDRCAVTLSSNPGADPMHQSEIYAIQAELEWGRDTFRAGRYFPITDAPHEQLRSAVVYDSKSFFVAWEDFRDGFPAIWGASFEFDGHVWNPNGKPISLGLDPAASAMSIGHYLVADRQASWGVHRVIGRTIKL